MSSSRLSAVTPHSTFSDAISGTTTHGSRIVYAPARDPDASLLERHFRRSMKGVVGKFNENGDVGELKCRLYNSVLLCQIAWGNIDWLDLKVGFIDLVCRVYDVDMRQIEDFDERISYAFYIISTGLDRHGAAQRTKFMAWSKKAFLRLRRLGLYGEQMNESGFKALSSGAYRESQNFGRDMRVALRSPPAQAGAESPSYDPPRMPVSQPAPHDPPAPASHEPAASTSSAPATTTRTDRGRAASSHIVAAPPRPSSVSGAVAARQINAQAGQASGSRLGPAPIVRSAPSFQEHFPLPATTAQIEIQNVQKKSLRDEEKRARIAAAHAEEMAEAQRLSALDPDCALHHELETAKQISAGAAASQEINKQTLQWIQNSARESSSAGNTARPAAQSAVMQAVPNDDDSRLRAGTRASLQDPECRSDVRFVADMEASQRVSAHEQAWKEVPTVSKTKLSADELAALRDRVVRACQDGWLAIPEELSPLFFTWRQSEMPEGYSCVARRFRNYPGCLSQPYEIVLLDADTSKIDHVPHFVVWKDDPSIPVVVAGAALRSDAMLADRAANEDCRPSHPDAPAVLLTRSGRIQIQAPHPVQSARFASRRSRRREQALKSEEDARVLQEVASTRVDSTLPAVDGAPELSQVARPAAGGGFPGGDSDPGDSEGDGPRGNDNDDRGFRRDSRLPRRRPPGGDPGDPADPDDHGSDSHTDLSASSDGNDPPALVRRRKANQDRRTEALRLVQLTSQRENRRYHGAHPEFSSVSRSKQLDFLELCDILLDLRDSHRIKDRWLLRWYGFFLAGPAASFTKVIRARIVKRLGNRFEDYFTVDHLIQELRRHFYPPGTHDSFLDYYSTLALPQPLLSKDLPTVFARYIKLARNLRFILDGDASGFRACLRRLIGSIVNFEQTFDSYWHKYDEEELVPQLQSLVRQYADRRQHKPMEQVEFFTKASPHAEANLPGVFAAGAATQPSSYQYQRHKSGQRKPRKCFGCDSEHHLYASCTHPQKEAIRDEKLGLLQRRINRERKSYGGQLQPKTKERFADAVHQLGLGIVANVSSVHAVSADSATRADPPPTPVPEHQDLSSDSDEEIPSDVQFLDSECNFADHADDLMLAQSLHEFAGSVDGSPDDDPVFGLRPWRQQPF